MNVISKSALTVAALALDFAAGSALEQVMDMNWLGDEVAEVTAAAAYNPPAVPRSYGPEPQPSGGVCKPSEHSVMVLEIDQVASAYKSPPRHVCVQALSGDPDFAALLKTPSAFVLSD